MIYQVLSHTPDYSNNWKSIKDVLIECNLYENYEDLTWVFTYEFLDTDTVILTYDSITATYTRT